jgi:hypothetical protein
MLTLLFSWALACAGAIQVSEGAAIVRRRRARLQARDLAACLFEPMVRSF